MDLPAERRELQRLRAIEFARLQTSQAEVERYERDATATGAFAPGFAEARYGRDVAQRTVVSLDGRLEALERRRINLINAAFRKLACRHYPDADRLLEIATITVDPDGAQ